MKKIAVYPGSFDPITNGHLSIIKRALKVIDELVVVVAHNPAKQGFFTIEERVNFLKELNLPNVKVAHFEGLLINACTEHNATIIIRGLRAMSDFEQEFQLALGNRRLSKDIETVFLMTSHNYSYLSSSLIKEIALNGGDIKGLVPDNVREALEQRRRK
ncbi:MAG: pantetheine-phosphate adenylyltransferase [Candidatus Margulisbacteria bacterium]|nr:pantetheine-phosphate adenylyltransferase [Candidatus Margulisiibacteriota bacterium]